MCIYGFKSPRKSYWCWCLQVSDVEKLVWQRKREDSLSRDVFRWAAFRCFLTRYCRSAYAGSVWTSPHLPSQHIPPFTASQRNRGDGESEKKDRFQYQPVIWLLRLDRIMPYRQTLRNLPLMKYDMCANGAPPPIQQPVITFQNKYTKRLLKKKERQQLYSSGAKWAGSGRWHAAPLRILASRDWSFTRSARYWLPLSALTLGFRCFFIR